MTDGPDAGRNGLTFPWHHPYRIPWMLMAFMGASVLLHAISFYAFQVVYPTAATLRIPAARLTLIDLSDPALLPLKNRIEAENPALILSTVTAPGGTPEASMVVGHTPTFASTTLRLLAPSFESVEPLPAPNDLFARLALPSRPTTPPAFAETSLPAVRFVTPEDLLLEAGTEVELPSDMPAAQTSPAVFLVTVDASGNLQSVLLLESSGVEPMDRFAESTLRAATVLNPEEAAGLTGIVHVLVYPKGPEGPSPSMP